VYDVTNALYTALYMYTCMCYGSRNDANQNLHPAQHICFLEYVSAWKDFLSGRFPARSLLQHDVNSL